MRSDEAVVTSSAPATMKTWSPSELGWNGASLAAGAGTTGAFVSVAGYRKLAVIINSSQAYSLFIYTRIAGVQSNDALLVNGSLTPISSSANLNRTLLVDCCFEEVAIFVKNTGASSATITCAMTGIA